MLHLGDNKEKFKHNKIDGVTVLLEADSQQDRETLARMFALVLEDKGELKVGGLIDSASELAQMLELRTNGLRSCTIKVDKGDTLDSATITVSLDKKPFFFSNQTFGYISSRGQVDFFCKVGKGWSEVLKKYKTLHEQIQKLEESQYVSHCHIGAKFSGDSLKG